MSRRGDEELVQDMLEAVQRILSYAKGLAYKEFLADPKTQDAVVRNLEIVGEAAKNISDALKKKCPEVAWSDLARTRDKLVHHYFGVNFDIVWDIIEDALPEVLKSLRDCLEK